MKKTPTSSPPPSEDSVASQGICPQCSAPNEYSHPGCASCGARLPWAAALEQAARQAAQQAQEEIQYSEERFQRIADAASGIIYEWEYESGTLRRFGNIANLLGYGANEIDATTHWWMSLVHPDDRTLIENVFQSALQDGAQYFTAEYRVRCKNGEYIWLWDRGCISRDEQGKALRTIGQTTNITKYKEALLQYEVSEERANRLVDANIIGILFCDLDGVIRDANDAFLQIIGYERADLESGVLDWQSLTPPGHEAADNAAIEQLTTSGAARAFEKEYLHRDGHPVPILIGAAMLKNSQQAVAFVHDLTQQKQTEKALRLSEERYRMVSELTSDFTYLSTLKADGTIFLEWITDSFTRIAGYTTEEIREVGWTNIIHPEDLPVAAAFVGRLMAGASETIEYRIHTKTGNLRWMQIHGRPLFDENGRVTQLIGAGKDITGRKQIVERQQFLAKASDLLASSLDYQTVVGEVARLALPYFADYCFVDLLKNDEIMQVAVAHTEPEKESLIRELRERNPVRASQSLGVGEVMRSGEPQIISQFSDETWRAYANDEYSIQLVRQLNPCSYLCYPLRARGRTIGAITFMTCRERRYTEQDLHFAGELADRAARAVDNARLYRDAQDAQKLAEAARMEAEAANRAKDEFLATVSHELRTPLNAILGWSNLLQMGDLDEASTRQAVETIERNARAQTQIVSDLLDVSRIITGKLRLETTPIELLPLIESAVDAVQSAAKAKGVNVEVEKSAQDVLVMGDATRLQQVLWNLLSNAVRFTPSGGRITIGLEARNNMACLCVADTGQGIAPEFLPFVFDRFRQAESSYTRKYSGLGLGLAIVRHIVEMHGGSVEAWSEGLGQGARFTVCVPLPTSIEASATTSNEEATTSQVDPPPETAAHEKMLAHNSRVLAGRCILVVDDQEDARILMQSVLGSYDTTVETAASVSEAVNKLRTTQFDALISDIGMPGEDGYSLIQKIRGGLVAHCIHIPAIAFSAFAREEDKQRALELGFNDYLAKPISPRNLVSALATLLQK